MRLQELQLNKSRVQQAAPGLPHYHVEQNEEWLPGCLLEKPEETPSPPAHTCR